MKRNFLSFKNDALRRILKVVEMLERKAVNLIRFIQLIKASRARKKPNRPSKYHPVQWNGNKPDPCLILCATWNQPHGRGK
jgi:hypothetical protein